MSENQTAKEWFSKLKPIAKELDELAPTVSRVNSRETAQVLNGLLAVLESMDDPEEAMTAINIQCIIIPLLKIYKAMATQEKRGYDIVIEPWLKIMRFLLCRTLIKIAMKPQFAIQLIVLFSTFIEQHTKSNGSSNILRTSEEIKLLAVQCLSAALPLEYHEGRHQSIDGPFLYSKLIEAVRGDSFILIASKCITGLLQVIQFEQNLQLRLESIKVLSQLLHDNLQDIDTLAQLLPGIVSKLCATINQKLEKENHQVTCSVLQALGDLIQAVMQDDMNDTLDEITSFDDIFHKSAEKEEEEEKDANKIRSKAWYAETKKNLNNMLKRTLELRIYPDWRTRFAFVDFSYELLSSCSRTLDTCIQPLIEMLILHADDDYSQVSTACQSHIEALRSSHSFESTIAPILKDNLYEWIMRFPQYLISKDEKEKTIAMSLISATVILLKDQTESVLSIALVRASDGWMTGLEIDKDSLSVLEERKSDRFIELQSDSKRPTPIYPRIRFKYIASDVATNKLNRMLNVMGQYCDLQAWIHHFMRYVSGNTKESNDPQAVYIIHALLSGGFATSSTDNLDEWIDADDASKNNGQAELKNVAARLLNDTMSILTEAATNTGSSNTLVPTTSTPQELDKETEYVLTVCFGLQVVGLTAYIVDQGYLQEQFITILYPLLAHLGSSNVYIHTYALITLDAIAVICGCNTAQELAIQNIDYIINMISQHISVLSANVRVPLVLKALIHVGGYAAIHYLDDTVQEIYNALERYSLNDWLCNELCGVLAEIVQTLEKNASPVVVEENHADQQEADDLGVSPEVESFVVDDRDIMEQEYKSMEEIGKYFLDRQEKGLHDNLTLDQIMEQGNLPMDMPQNEDDSEREEVEEKEVPLTHEQEMSKAIMDKASYFLTASSPQLRSQMLSLLTSGVSILADHPTELNQLIHSMWPFIVNRFGDPQNYVVLNAAKLVEKVSQVSTDFLSKKFSEDLWPRFKQLLQSGVQAASSDPSLTGYSIYSLYHRTQLCLFKTLARIAYHVPMRQILIKDILDATRFYYRNSQVHEQLSLGCQDLFTALSSQQPDTVWLYEVQQQQRKLETPSDLLDTFQVPDWWFTIPLHHGNGSLVKFK